MDRLQTDTAGHVCAAIQSSGIIFLISFLQRHLACISDKHDSAASTNVSCTVMRGAVWCGHAGEERLTTGQSSTEAHSCLW
ncbi:hypothetical protein O3P69_000399 [Scylla paramamosain]|uniref:Uncharacterized protein n=1 Tax=Scylla paramamosain TaxID=85552 RepID=A0AAW0UTL9_SCYPA